MFEWLYYRRYGQSFIESLSLHYLTPILGGADTLPTTPDCKVWRNPMNLFRGAEYSRYLEATGSKALTTHDMDLTIQDYQSFFTREQDLDSDIQADAIMFKAWREKEDSLRIGLAEEALMVDPNCTTALILVAEEKAQTIIEVEKLFKHALRSVESQIKRTQQMVREGHKDSVPDPHQKHETNLCIYIKRRLGMCARKLGRYREAAKIMKDLIKEFPMISVLNVHENLVEVLLEMQAYSEVQQVLAKYDDINLPKSATICYTVALLKTRSVCEKFSLENASRRGLSSTEMTAVDAIHRAVEFNPHVPKYLLEQKSIVLPPEHILKRGDSEAVAYAFHHLQHWKRVEGALSLLHCTWEGAFRLIPYPLDKGHLFHPYPACTENADRDLLPAHHELSVYPKRELPFFILFTGFLCTFMAGLSVTTHHYPGLMARVAKITMRWVMAPILFLFEKMEDMLPAQLWRSLTDS
ncbi:protein ST7 homolog isoform X2 [Corticium candelabrum]|uniref:protein ST7 homolog isoform X2 n=1 Tax=Corticium candelabrum TaxID=121492 RepID=UPI002E25837A|nr:protein ST7 homolog isoform X2 [Corticium candelabrum]